MDGLARFGVSSFLDKSGSYDVSKLDILWTRGVIKHVSRSVKGLPRSETYRIHHGKTMFLWIFRQADLVLVILYCYSVLKNFSLGSHWLAPIGTTLALTSQSLSPITSLERRRKMVAFLIAVIPFLAVGGLAHPAARAEAHNVQVRFNCNSR